MKIALALVLLAGCYPKGPTPPSCAQDPTQPWCVPPAFQTCQQWRVDVDADAGVRDDAGTWHYPSTATVTPCTKESR